MKTLLTYKCYENDWYNIWYIWYLSNIVNKRGKKSEN